MKQWCISRFCPVALLAVAWGVGAAETNAPILQIESGGHTAICRWLGFTPNAEQLMSAGEDRVLRVWDLRNVIQAIKESGGGASKLSPIPLVQSLRPQLGPDGKGYIFACAISPRRLPGGGWLVAVGGGDPTDDSNNINFVQLFDSLSGNILGILGMEAEPLESILALAFSQDGSLLASGGKDDVLVWNTRSAFLDAERNENGTLKIPCQRLRVMGGNAVISLAFTTGTQGAAGLASATYNGNSIEYWSRSTNGEWERRAEYGGGGAEFQCVVPSRDGRYFATQSSDNGVRLWNAHDGNMIRLLGETGNNAKLRANLAFTPDSFAVVAASHRDAGGCHVWRIPDGREIARFSEHDDFVYSIAAAKVATPSLNTGKTEQRTMTLIASGGGNNHDIFLWDPWNGHMLGHIAGVGRAVWSVGFSKDGRWVGWGNTKGISQSDVMAPLEHAFDLAEILPSESTVGGNSWHRALLSQADLTARLQDGANHTLVVQQAGLKIAEIESENADAEPVRCYSFLPRGGLAVGTDFRLAIYDPISGDALRQLRGHTGPVTSVAPSPDGKMLVSGSADQTVKIWNLATGELLLSVFVGRAPDGRLGEWVAWTPAGYYKSSPGGDKLIGWHLNRGPDQAAEFVAAWQMRKLFEKPEIVSLVPSTLSVAGAVEQYHKDPLRRREAPVAVEEDLDRLRPPKISLYEPASYTQVTNDRVRLRARVWPVGRQTITEVRVLVNGRPPKELPGFDPTKATGANKPVDIETEVTLEPGMNIVEVLAATDSATSEPARVDVLRITQVRGAQPAKPSCYVLGIGVAEYQDKSLKLLFPADDARDVAAAMQRQRGKLFDRVESRVLTNRQVTSTEIKRGLSWLKQSATQSDLAVVFVSSHGCPDGRDEFYIAPYDFDSDEPSVFGFSKTELLERLKNLPCKVLVVLDACYSGRVVEQMLASKTAQDDPLNQVVKDFTSVSAGLVMIASSGSGEVSLEKKEWGHGAVALGFIEALTGLAETNSVVEKVSADQSGDGVVDVDELCDYVKKRVQALTGGLQHVLSKAGTPRTFPVAVVGKLVLPQGNLDGVRLKGPWSDPLTIPVANLRADLRKAPAERFEDPKLFEVALRRRYPKTATVAQITPQELEFKVEYLRGFVTGEPKLWERLVLNFTVNADDKQVRIRCWPCGYHALTDGNKPPEQKVFEKNGLWPKYETELKQEANALLIQLRQEFTTENK